MTSSEAAARAESHGFSQERRIRRRTEFQQVFDRGFRVQSRHFTVLFLPNRLGKSRLGIVASRKIGGAVERNRAKRLIREMFRLNVQGSPAPVDLVVIPRREFLDASFEVLTKEFRNAWRRGERTSGHAGA